MICASRRRLLRIGVCLIGGALASGCGLVPAAGRAPSGPPRIGYLDAGINDPSVEAAVRDGLRELGYVHGQNLLIEDRSAGGNVELLPGLAGELINLPVQLIVVSNDVTILAASRATATIPIVVAGGNAVSTGVITNVAHPGGNVTGVNAGNGIPKWIELIKESLPTLSHLAAVLDHSSPVAPMFVQQLQDATQSLGIDGVPYDLRDLNDLPAVLARVKADGAEAVLIVPSGVVGAGQDPRISSAVVQSGLPAISQSRIFAVNGGLLSRGVNSPALARRSAAFIDKILKGSRAGDLPLELPDTFDVVVNLQTARTLGITIPQSVLSQATEVIL